MRTEIFVYGTLRRGYCNHGLLSGAGFLGKARTARPCALFVDPVGIPYAARFPARARIIGEVYSVDEPTLAALDRLEEHPVRYVREEAPVEPLAGGGPFPAWIYFGNPPRGDLMEGGDYAASPLALRNPDGGGP